jgi:phosphoribosylformylglycinamidine synthase
MKVRVVVTLKKSVLDPQGQAVQHALESLGFKGISGVRMGKYIEITFDGKGKDQKAAVRQMCEKLLANPVIEQYEIL